jgi:hypothetical protein
VSATLPTLRRVASLSDEQKDWFLLHIRSGDDRGTAAAKVGATGTQFRRLCNSSSPRYDADFAKAYDEACTERGPVKRELQRPLATPRTTTDQGFTKADYLTEDDQEEFLELVREGFPRDKAAREIGTSLGQIHRLANRSRSFAEKLRQAYDEGLPHFKDKLRAKAYEMAMEGDYRALRDMAIVHLEEYAVLRTQRHEIGGLDGGDLRLLVEERFRDLPPALLDGLIRELEAQQPKQLEPPRQLPREAA